MAKTKHNNGLESLEKENPKEWEVPEPLTYAPPRWMSEAYPGDEEDMAHDVYSAIFWQTLEKDVAEAKASNKPIPDMNNVAERATEIARTIMAAAKQASAVSDTAQRAFFALVYKVKQNNLQHLDKAEYDTIEEWLIDRLEMDPKAAEISNISYLMGEVFPMLEKVSGGYKPKELLSIKGNWGRTSAAVPYLRFIGNRYKEEVKEVENEIEKKTKRITKLVFLNKDRSPKHKLFAKTAARISELRENVTLLEEKHEVVVIQAAAKWQAGVEKTLKVIADPNIKPWGKEGERTVKAALFHGDSPDVVMYEGLQGVLPGRSIFVLILRSRYERTVENRLGGLVEWRLTDPVIMAKEIEKAVLLNPFADETTDDDCLEKD